MSDFEQWTVRREWQVHIRAIDHRGQNTDKFQLLARYPTRELANEACKRFGTEHKYVPGRLIPFWTPADKSFALDYCKLTIEYHDVRID